MKVKPMDDEEKYAEFVKDRSFFHKLGYKKTIEEAYGFKPHYLVAEDEAGIKGVLPLFEIRQMTGSKLVSLPFSTEGGVIYDTEEAKQALIKEAVELTKRLKPDYLELRQKEDLSAGLVLKGYYCHMVLDLKEDKAYRRDLRRGIKKAEEAGIEVRDGTLGEFYRLHSKNMRDLGTPVDDKNFFKAIADNLPENIRIKVAELGGNPVSALFLLRYGRTVKAEWQSTDKKHARLHASDIIYDRAIKEAREKGAEMFDFGRSVEGEGTYFFKEKFGARPSKLHYAYFMNKVKIPDTRKTNWKRSLFAMVWKRMPLAAANKIGPRLRRLFP